MSRCKIAIHFLIILSMLSAGVASAHICLDDDAEHNIYVVSVADKTDNSSSDVAFDCCDSSCHHNCNHLFSLSSNLTSGLSDFSEKNLVDSYNDSIPLNYTSLPFKPPKA